MRARRYGFTIVEILVVIAIISALVAISFAVYGSASQKQKLAACQLQMKKLHDAVVMYHDDTGRYPEKQWSAVVGSNAAVDPLRAMIESGKITTIPYCPLDPGIEDEQVESPSEEASYAELYNYWGFAEDTTPTVITSSTDAEAVYMTLVNPATGQQDFWITNNLEGTAGPNSDFPGLANPAAPPSTIITACRHHKGKYVVLRLDGSLEVINADDVSSDFWPLSKPADRKSVV